MSKERGQGNNFGSGSERAKNFEMHLHNNACRRGFKDIKTIGEDSKKVGTKTNNLRTLRRFPLAKGPSSLDPRRTGTGTPVSWRGTSGPNRCSMAIKLVFMDLEPDPHWLGCPGSGSVLGMLIRIQKHGNWPKLTKQTWSPAFQKVFCTFVSMFFSYVLL
jgi:hypothetical protein